MKIKTLAYLVIASAVAYTGAAWYSGYQTQQWYEAMLEKGNIKIAEELGAYGLEGFKIVEYKRGIFSSTVTIDMTMHLLPLTDESLSLRFQDKIEHGPLIWHGDGFLLQLANIQGKLLETEDTQHWFSYLKSKNNPTAISYSAALSFSKAVKGSMAVSEFSSEDKKLYLSGAEYKYEFNFGFSKGKDETAISQFSMFSGEEEQLETNNIKLNSNIDNGKLNLNASAKEIVFKKFGELKFRLINPRVSIAMTDFNLINDEESKASLKYSITGDEIIVGDAVLSKPLLSFEADKNGTLVDLKHSLKIDNIKIKNYNSGSLLINYQMPNLYYQFYSMQQNVFRSPSSQYVVDLDKILNSEVSFIIDPLTWTNSKGSSSLVLSITEFTPKTLMLWKVGGPDVIKNNFPPVQLDLILVREQVQELLEAVVADNASVKEKMRYYDFWVEHLVSQNLASNKEDVLSIHWKFKEGVLSSQEQDIPVDAFILLMQKASLQQSLVIDYSKQDEANLDMEHYTEE